MRSTTKNRRKKQQRLWVPLTSYMVFYECDWIGINDKYIHNGTLRLALKTKLILNGLYMCINDTDVAFRWRSGRKETVQCWYVYIYCFCVCCVLLYCGNICFVIDELQQIGAFCQKLTNTIQFELLQTISWYKFYTHQLHCAHVFLMWINFRWFRMQVHMLYRMYAFALNEDGAMRYYCILTTETKENVNCIFNAARDNMWLCCCFCEKQIIHVMWKRCKSTRLMNAWMRWQFNFSQQKYKSIERLQKKQ